MASAAQDGMIFLYNLEKCQLIGFLKYDGFLKSMRWEICEEASGNTRLYVLHSDFDDLTASILTAFDLPEMSKIEVGDKLQIQLNFSPLLSSYSFLFNCNVTDFLVAPK
jgi:hypothetical protein